MFFQNLQTKRLILKNISIEDRDFIFSEFSVDNKAVNKYLFDAEPLTDISGADEIINFYLTPEPRNRHRWILTRKSDSIKIGTCGFHIWLPQKGRVDIGYDLKEEFWGNGYMQEAIEEIIEFAKGKMHIKEICANIYIDNIRSIHLVEKFGFVQSDSYNELFRGKKYFHYRCSLYM